LPLAEAAGVPAIVAVPFRAAVNRIPGGSMPCSLTVAIGYPVVRTVKLPFRPWMKVAWFDEVIAVAW
jgi:hypothetical protein